MKLKSSQLKTAVLSIVLGLFPDSIILLSDDGYVETADTDGRFHDVDDLPVWTVSGNSLQPLAGTSAGPGPSGINSYSYQSPQARLAKWSRGKSRWTPATFSTSTLVPGPRQLPGVCAHEPSVSQDECNQSSEVPAEWRKSIEVCKWIEQKKVWKKVSNLPMVMTEATANIPCMMQMVSDDVFGSEETVLLDIDYSKIPDTSATRGETQLKLGLCDF